MYSYTEHEEQALKIGHHPNKYPQANARGWPSHHYTNCQPNSNNGRICEEWKTAIVKPLL